MIVGCIKEIKQQEYRVGLTPNCVSEYVRHGHSVYIQSGAGESAGFFDDDYLQAGAAIADSREIFEKSDMIVKVKEPLPSEYDCFREGQILYTYLHLAADETLTRALLSRKVKAVAYETMESADRSLPCLRPTSEIAGRLSVQEGAKCLGKMYGGRGVLLGGVPGVESGKVVILGGGVVGTNACKIAIGMGAQVIVMDISIDRLAYLDDVFGNRINTLYSSEANVMRAIHEADLVIGAVLIPGAVAPKLLRREHLGVMRKGSVVVDVAIDQGGCFETSRPTTHSDPTFEVGGVIHYCVANMAGAVPYTSSLALTHSTLGYGLQIANLGLEKACEHSRIILTGLNAYQGNCTYKAVADAFSLDYIPATRAIL